MPLSTKWAAVSLMRRPPQEGQKPRLWQERDKPIFTAGPAKHAYKAARQNAAVHKRGEFIMDRERQGAALLVGRLNKRRPVFLNNSVQNRVFGLASAIRSVAEKFQPAGCLTAFRRGRDIVPFEHVTNRLVRYRVAQVV